MIFNQSPFNLSTPPVYKPHGQILSLFWSSATKRISQTFIIIFSSVYIYKNFSELGFSHANSILIVCLFFALFLISKILFLSFAEELSRKTGFKKVIWLSALPYAFFISSMIYAEIKPAFFFIAAVFYGSHSALYWWGYHGYFIKAGDKDHYGGGIGAVEFINTLAIITAPFMGGILIEIFGFNFLYALAGLFMFLSLLLLGEGDDRRQNTDIRFSEVIRLIFRHKLISSAYVGAGVEGTFYILGWPLFLYFLFGEVVSLGTFIAISMLVAAVLGVFVGNKIDRDGEKNIVVISAPLLSFSWLLKTVSINVPVLVVAESIRTLGEKMLSINLMELTYKKAKESVTAKAILFRELSIIVGSFICIFIVAVSVLVGISLNSLFFPISLIALFPLISVLKRKI